MISYYNSGLIRINLRDPEIPDYLKKNNENLISIPLKAKFCLQEIKKCLEKNKETIN
jgi:hypothetical protein